LYEAGELDRAVEEYQTAYKLLPLPEMLFNIAQAHRLKGAADLAAQYYRRFLAAKPTGSVADEAREHLRELDASLARPTPRTGVSDAEPGKAPTESSALPTTGTQPAEPDRGGLRPGGLTAADKPRKWPWDDAQMVEVRDDGTLVDGASDAKPVKHAPLSRNAILLIIGGTGAGLGVVAIAVSIAQILAAEDLDQQSQDALQKNLIQTAKNLRSERDVHFAAGYALIGVGAALAVTGTTLIAVAAARRRRAGPSVAVEPICSGRLVAGATLNVLGSW